MYCSVVVYNAHVSIARTDQVQYMMCCPSIHAIRMFLMLVNSQHWVVPKETR